MSDVKKYLDQEGVGILWGQIIAKLGNKADLADFKKLTDLIGELPEDADSDTIVEYVSEAIEKEANGGNITSLTEDDILSIIGED